MKKQLAGLALLVLCALQACSQQADANKQTAAKETEQSNTPKMKVEIWSDVMCPFCYIGKRKFEAALEKFPNRNNIEIVWKSFQLNPDLKTDPSKNTLQHLSESKGWSMDYTRETVAYVSNMAKEVGLNYDFDHAVVANSFDAHRLIQLAKSKGLGDAMEERLFKAYFTEGKNTADHTVLTQLAVEIGLNESDVKTTLSSDAFAKEVNQDLAEADQLRITGVPFFVFDRKYAVSGAQDSKVFADTLSKAWSTFAQQSR